ncbi:MAG: redoxin domain-containing protein [Desulfomicrobium escambiense]|nr:redoxin domain-containing protein [Desulfomicrobium escambiense]
MPERTSKPRLLQAGQAAIDFTLPDQDGKLWKLSDVLKDYNAVVLAFYPKDDTGGLNSPVC